MLQFCFLSKKKKREDVTILRDTVTTSWFADDICFSYIKYILLVRHLGFVYVLLYIACSGLLQLVCVRLVA